MDKECADFFHESLQEFIADGGPTEGIVEWIGDAEEAKKVRIIEYPTLPTFIKTLLLAHPYPQSLRRSRIPRVLSLAIQTRQTPPSPLHRQTQPQPPNQYPCSLRLPNIKRRLVYPHRSGRYQSEKSRVCFECFYTDTSSRVFGKDRSL